MNHKIVTPFISLLLSAVLLQGCVTDVNSPTPVNNSTPSSSPSNNVSVPLPVLNRLFGDKLFTAALKSRVQLTDEQIATLRKVSSDELAKLRSAKGENQATADTEASARVLKSIRDLAGSDKADQILAMALERQSELPETEATKDEPTLLKGPNAVPPDTRVVVNIPAFRMDIFREGRLFKSYKIGIGYQQYPLPTGFRKAEMIIFKPTWTQPNEPWATSPGEIVPAGSSDNPLGPIKIPIGGANLIHGR